MFYNDNIPTKKARHNTLLLSMAEREGFEPPDGCPSTVFKTAAFDHSAISPYFIKLLIASNFDLG